MKDTKTNSKKLTVLLLRMPCKVMKLEPQPPSRFEELIDCRKGGANFREATRRSAEGS